MTREGSRRSSGCWVQSRWSPTAARSRSAARSSARSSRSCCCGVAPPFPRERLVDALWGERPPASAISSLQVYVHGLRRAVGADRFETRGNAYRVCVEPDELDVARFERLLAEARDALAGGAPGHADELLASALGLWRGTRSPISAIARCAPRRPGSRICGCRRSSCGSTRGSRSASTARSWRSSRSSSPPSRTASGCASSSCSRSTARVASRTRSTPTRTRAASLDELGVEPGPALRELERAVLRHDPALAPEAPRRGAAAAAAGGADRARRPPAGADRGRGDPPTRRRPARHAHRPRRYGEDAARARGRRASRAGDARRGGVRRPVDRSATPS